NGLPALLPTARRRIPRTEGPEHWDAPGPSAFLDVNFRIQRTAVRIDVEIAPAAKTFVIQLLFEAVKGRRTDRYPICSTNLPLAFPLWEPVWRRNDHAVRQTNRID